MGLHTGNLALADDDLSPDEYLKQWLHPIVLTAEGEHAFGTANALNEDALVLRQTLRAPRRRG